MSAILSWEHERQSNIVVKHTNGKKTFSVKKQVCGIADNELQWDAYYARTSSEIIESTCVR